MMSVTSSSPSSVSSMNGASSVSSTSISSSLRAASPFLPWASASASSSETNSASGGLRSLLAVLGLRAAAAAAAVAAAAAAAAAASAAARHRRDDDERRAALRADDRVLAEVVELRAATAAETLRAELGFCHASVSLNGRDCPEKVAFPLAACNASVNSDLAELRPAVLGRRKYRAGPPHWTLPHPCHR